MFKLSYSLVCHIQSANGCSDFSCRRAFSYSPERHFFCCQTTALFLYLCYSEVSFFLLLGACYLDNSRFQPPDLSRLYVTISFLAQLEIFVCSALEKVKRVIPPGSLGGSSCSSFLLLLLFTFGSSSFSWSRGQSTFKKHRFYSWMWQKQHVTLSRWFMKLHRNIQTNTAALNLTPGTFSGLCDNFKHSL